MKIQTALFISSARVVEWSKAPDLRSGSEGIRGFNSHPSHLYYSDMPVVRQKPHCAYKTNTKDRQCLPSDVKSNPVGSFIHRGFFPALAIRTRRTRHQTAYGCADSIRPCNSRGAKYPGHDRSSESFRSTRNRRSSCTKQLFWLFFYISFSILQLVILWYRVYVVLLKRVFLLMVLNQKTVVSAQLVISCFLITVLLMRIF